MEVLNPRFPHKLRVLRPVVDEYGSPVFDEYGEPAYSAVTLTIVAYEKYLPVWLGVDKGPCPCRRSGTPIPKTYVSDTCVFGYRQQTANAVVSGDVIITEMKIACPLIIGEIKAGDILELTDSDRTYRVTVVKKVNTNFGTNIWYTEARQ